MNFLTNKDSTAWSNKTTRHSPRKKTGLSLLSLSPISETCSCTPREKLLLRIQILKLNPYFRISRSLTGSERCHFCILSMVWLISSHTTESSRTCTISLSSSNNSSSPSFQDPSMQSLLSSSCLASSQPTLSCRPLRKKDTQPRTLDFTMLKRSSSTFPWTSLPSCSACTSLPPWVLDLSGTTIKKE